MSVATINETRQYLTFKLAEEIFTVDVAKVREILEWTSITKVPQTPEYMCGVINLRGSVVPVIDLRRKFGMEARAADRDNCIVVLEVDMGGERTVVGALAGSFNTI